MQPTDDAQLQDRLERLGAEIEHHRARIQDEGKWGGSIKAELQRIAEQHERLCLIARSGNDDAAESAATVAAELSNLKNAFERWMVSVDTTYTRKPHPRHG